MGTVGRMKKGKLLLKGNVLERTPAIKNGLIAHYPLDGSYASWRTTPQKLRVLFTSANDVVDGHTISAWMRSSGAIMTFKTQAEFNALASGTVKNAYDLILLDCGWWASTAVMEKAISLLKSDGISVVSIGNDNTTNTFVQTYTKPTDSAGATVRGAHDVLIDPNYFPFAVENDKYVNRGSADVYGGAAVLQNGAVPLYRRSDHPHLITGYMWEAANGAIFYHDQEGSSGAAEEYVRQMILYAANRSNNIQATNVVLTDKGADIGEATTNVCTNVLNPDAWPKSNRDPLYGFVSDRVVQTDKGLAYERTVTGGDYRGTLFNVPWTTPTNMTVPWTFSVYARVMEGVPDARVQLNWQGLDSAGTRVDISANHDFTDHQWKRISLTATPSASAMASFNSPMKIYVNSKTTGNRVTIQLCLPQMEQKNYMTPFANGSRAAASMKIPIQGDYDFTVFFRFKPNATWYEKHTASYGKRVFNLYDKISGKKIWWEEYGNTPPITSSSPWIGFDEFNGSADGYPWHWHVSGAKFDIGEECWFALTKSNSAWKVYFYSPKHAAPLLKVASTTHSLAAVTGFSPREIEFLSNFNGTYRDVLFYNRALSEQEIKKIGNPAFSITKQGHAEASVVESPIAKPNAYFPLTFSGANHTGTLLPTTETNISFTADGAWLDKGTTNFIVNPKFNEYTKHSVTGWDQTLHADALSISGWSNGYNGGVTDPSIGYHAKWVLEGRNGGPCIKMMNINSQFKYTVAGTSMKDRWMGISRSFGTPTANGWVVGDKITISWNQKVDTKGGTLRVGIHYRSLASGSNVFTGAIGNTSQQAINKWERFSATYTVTDDWDLAANMTLYLYGNNSPEATIWAEDIQVEKKPHAYGYTMGTSAQSRLVYNYSDVLPPLNTGQFSISFWAKFGASGAYRLCGCWPYFYFGASNGNRVVFSWQENSANTNNANTQRSVTGTTNIPVNEWVMLTCSVKVGASIELYLNGKKEATFTSAFQLTSTSTTFSVNGFSPSDGNYPMNGILRDLMIFKKGLSATEIQDIYKTFMRSNKENTLLIQDGLREGESL